jgi:hypothetical protein
VQEWLGYRYTPPCALEAAKFHFKVTVITARSLLIKVLFWSEHTVAFVLCGASCTAVVLVCFVACERCVEREAAAAFVLCVLVLVSVLQLVPCAFVCFTGGADMYLVTELSPALLHNTETARYIGARPRHGRYVAGVGQHL